MSHAAVEVAHPLDLGSFSYPSELLCNVATAAALAFDHASLAHLHNAGEVVSHKAMVRCAWRMKRFDLGEASKLGRAVTTSVDIPGRAYAHAVATNGTAERNTTF